MLGRRPKLWGNIMEKWNMFSLKRCQSLKKQCASNLHTSPSICHYSQCYRRTEWDSLATVSVETSKRCTERFTESPVGFITAVWRLRQWETLRGRSVSKHFRLLHNMVSCNVPFRNSFCMSHCVTCKSFGWAWATNIVIDDKCATGATVSLKSLPLSSWNALVASLALKLSSIDFV